MKLRWIISSTVLLPPSARLSITIPLDPVIRHVFPAARSFTLYHLSTMHLVSTYISCGRSPQSNLLDRPLYCSTFSLLCMYYVCTYSVIKYFVPVRLWPYVYTWLDGSTLSTIWWSVKSTQWYILIKGSSWSPPGRDQCLCQFQANFKSILYTVWNFTRSLRLLELRLLGW